MFILKKKRLLKTVDVKTSEKFISLEEETVMFLKESNKLQEFKKEQFDKHQVMIEPELTDLRNIWIVCEKSKIHNAEKELRGLTDEKKIDSCDFTTQEPMEFRFLMEHCWDDIKEKEKSCKAEGVIVFDIKHDSLKVKGTKAGRDEMINFLKRLVNNIDSKVCIAFVLTVVLMSKFYSVFRRMSYSPLHGQLKRSIVDILQQDVIPISGCVRIACDN